MTVKTTASNPADTAKVLQAALRQELFNFRQMHSAVSAVFRDKLFTDPLKTMVEDADAFLHSAALSEAAQLVNEGLTHPERDFAEWLVAADHTLSERVLEVATTIQKNESLEGVLSEVYIHRLNAADEIRTLLRQYQGELSKIK